MHQKPKEDLSACQVPRDRVMRILYHAVVDLLQRVEKAETTINTLKRGAKTMALNMTQLQDKIAALETEAAAREVRDQAEEAATDAQIAALQASVAALQAIIDAGGGGSAADQAAIDAAVTRVEAVIASLQAADPTPPVV